jgi:group I intron endonuclease
MGIIYKITNKINNKEYIGQSIHNDDKYYGSGKYIKRAIEKYGTENFEKEIIEECSNDILDEREKYWINEYNTFENGYNLTLGGQNGWMTGKKHTEETKEKISKKLKGENNPFYGKKHSDETKKKISNSIKESDEWNKKIKSKEHRNKLSKSQKGRKHTDETKRKISEINKGKKRSAETKKKMSEIQKQIKPFYDKKHSVEAKNKIGDVHRGKIVSDETKEKMRQNNLGKKLSEETKEKISKSLCRKKVIHLKNNKIIIFNSTLEVCDYLNINMRKVQYYCRKKDINNKYNIIYEEDYKK